MKNKRLMRVKLWIGVSLLAGALWTGAALGGVIAGDTTTAPPPNDDFANAIVLTGANVTRLADTNVDATLEVGEPTTVAGSSAGASVWYSWTAPSNNQVVIDLATSDFDTLLAVYTGNAVGALTEVASNDDFIASVTSRVRFQPASGTVYRIRVDGFNDGLSVSEGSINLHLHQDPPPANDNFANAVVLTGMNDSSLGDTNEGATLETGEVATVAGSTGGASVWYSWTAPSTGQATIDTATSDFNTLLGVYTGASVNALTEVASNDDSLAGETSQVRFRANSGTTYRIKVDGRQADTGTSVTLTATAGSGSSFSGWSGACTGFGTCAVTMDAAKSVTATFAPPSPPQTVVNCVVPNVKGKTLAAVKRKIAAGHCTTGRVTKAKSKTVPKGKVISQSQVAGKKLARGAKVNLVISRGKR